MTPAEAIATAFASILTWPGIAAVLAGTIIGTIVAILPGLGGPTAMALLLPVTITMDPLHALMFLMGIIAAGGFAGSITSILLGIPGDETNAATVLDGHALARQGRAGYAIGASATASCLGSAFGVMVLLVAIPFMRAIILAFGPGEVFAITAAGVLLVGAIDPREVAIKGLLAGLLGMALGMIGFSFVLGHARFVFGQDQLFDGLPLVSVLIGLFAIPELVRLVVERHPVSDVDAVNMDRRDVWHGMRACLSRPGLLIRSSAIGTAIGIVPGVGGTVACWVSYFAAQRSSPDPETFGTGRIEGVIAPEAAIDSKDGGQLMPLLALGLPGGVSTAIMLSAFLIHGIEPGRRMFSQNLHIVFALVFVLLFASFTTSAIGLISARQLVRLTTVNGIILAPIIACLSIFGGFVGSFSWLGVVVVVGFGFVGYLMARGGYSRPALLIGFILAPLMETNFHTARAISGGGWAAITKPSVVAILLVAALLIYGPRLYARVRGTSAKAIMGPKPEAAERSTILADFGFLILSGVIVLAMGLQMGEFLSVQFLAPGAVLILAGALEVWNLVRVSRTVDFRTRRNGRFQSFGVLWSENKPVIGVWTWLTLLATTAYVLGLEVGSAVWLALFWIWYERKELSGRLVLRRAALVGVYLAGIHAIFSIALGMRLPGGLLF